MNPKVDAYLEGAGKWQEEMVKLRKVILDFGLQDASGILVKPGEFQSRLDEMPALKTAFEALGHGFPKPLWEDMADLIAENVKRGISV
jgi:uncharacterized protein YdeI (YjbR/CyaY-like superfamily)